MTSNASDPELISAVAGSLSSPSALDSRHESLQAMTRKLLNYLILAAAIAIALIGGHSLFFSPQTDSATPVEIRLSSWGASPVEGRLLKALLRDFEATHPGIQVKHEEISQQYMDVIKTRLIGEAAPDVFYLDSLEAPFLMSQGVLEPLDRYITPEFDLDDFEPTLLNSFKHQGQIYGLPKDYSTLALFYNKQAFAEAGLSRPPATWDELREYAKPLTRDRNQDGRIDQYGLGIMPEMPRQAYKIRAFGGQLIDAEGYAAFATEAGLRGLQPTVEQYRRDRTAALKSDVGTNSGSEMFGQGKVAMVIEGNWAIPYLTETFPDLEFGTAEVPRLNDQPGTMVFNVAYVMNQQTPHKAAAWELISYLTGQEGMQKWTETGVALPSRRSVAEALGYDQDPLRAALVAGVSYATPWQLGNYPAEIMNNFDNQFVSAVLGQQSLEQSMARSQAAANEQIKVLKE